MCPAMQMRSLQTMKSAENVFNKMQIVMIMQMVSMMLKLIKPTSLKI